MSIELTFSMGDELTAEAADYYKATALADIAQQALSHALNKRALGLKFPYFDTDAVVINFDKPLALDVYVTDTAEARTINHDTRHKDYATNILSFPSQLPPTVLPLMEVLPLGELVLCHEVILKEAAEQNKTPQAHLTHLMVHGILHLLGFDHELGQEAQDIMEGLEIEILFKLGIANPYEA